MSVFKVRQHSWDLCCCLLHTYLRMYVSLWFQWPCSAPTRVNKYPISMNADAMPCTLLSFSGLKFELLSRLHQMYSPLPVSLLHSSFLAQADFPGRFCFSFNFERARHWELICEARHNCHGFLDSGISCIVIWDAEFLLPLLNVDGFVIIINLQMISITVE